MAAARATLFLLRFRHGFGTLQQTSRYCMVRVLRLLVVASTFAGARFAVSAAVKVPQNEMPRRNHKATMPPPSRTFLACIGSATILNVLCLLLLLRTTVLVLHVLTIFFITTSFHVSRESSNHSCVMRSVSPSCAGAPSRRPCDIVGRALSRTCPWAQGGGPRNGSKECCVHPSAVQQIDRGIP